MQTFYSHGKLLITGEYVILDGATGLALPTIKGQSMTIEAIAEPKIIWRSLDNNGNTWFEDEFLIHEIPKPRQKSVTHNDISMSLIQILKVAKQLNPSFLLNSKGCKVTTSLEFPRDWGLGSSSTLINNIAHWAKVDAYKLLEKTFGGSGYDIACAQNNNPLTYQLQRSFDRVKTDRSRSAQGDSRNIKKVTFNPKFREHLYFVHLNKKQNSRDGIAHYKSNRSNLKVAISKISAITKLIINCDSLITFNGLINRHEAIISKLINTPTIKEQYFMDYNGSIKSLGAWGGDFVLITSMDNPESYFKLKGYETVIPYSDMILKQKDLT